VAVLSVWCQLNKNRILPFQFGLRLKAEYLPWAICLSRYMLCGNGQFEIIGVLVGYAYFYLKFGAKILNTPQVTNKEYGKLCSEYTTPKYYVTNLVRLLLASVLYSGKNQYVNFYSVILFFC